MINLHERLSEFSYGYGVTREVEGLLAARGLRATPFLPSLLHEAQLGFDVAFAGPGQVVMLQFKLGDELSRFRRQHAAQNIPRLDRPFWRFDVDTGEHQFLHLEVFERLGADVFYVAPRFSDWSAYDHAFQARRVLRRSLLIAPSAIRLGCGSGAAQHRIVYDRHRGYVCSEPRAIEEVSSNELVENIEGHARAEEPLRVRLERMASRDGGPRFSSQRQRSFRDAARTPEDALAATIGLEAWLQGAQVLFVTPTE